MKPENITQWLQKPNLDIDKAEVEALVKLYPYFLPARYMQAALLHEDKIHNPRALGHMRLYSANWLLYQDVLDKASGKKEYTILSTFIDDEAANEIEETSLPQIIEEEDDVTPDIAIFEPLLAEEPAADSTNNKEEQINILSEEHTEKMDEVLIQPAYTEDYFRHQGIVVKDELPKIAEPVKEEVKATDPKSLMVVMSFTEWLMHFRTKSQKEKEEEADRKAVKTMWQKEKLAAALEEEDDEIPEEVFEMAVHSLDKDEGLVSESLAEILMKQGKTEKAIEMYRKLSLRNPQKSAYFAQQISFLQKNTEI